MNEVKGQISNLEEKAEEIKFQKNTKIYVKVLQYSSNDILREREKKISIRNFADKKSEAQRR